MRVCHRSNLYSTLLFFFHFYQLNPTSVFESIPVMIDYSHLKHSYLFGSIHDLKEALLSILELLVQNGNHLPHHLHYHVIVE